MRSPSEDSENPRGPGIVLAGDGVAYRSIAVSSLRLDSEPAFALYLHPGPAQPFVLYAESRHRFTDQLLRRLLANNIRELYIREEEAATYRQYLRRHLPGVLGDSRIPVAEKAAVLYQSAQAVLEDLFARPPGHEAIEEGKHIIQVTVDLMTSQDFLLEHFLRTFDVEHYLYSHSINVAAYSIALALRAGYRDRPVLREIGNGALMHDIGMSRLPASLRGKSGPLSEWELLQVREHPVAGHDLLRACGGLGEIALDIVLHHHELLNGRGYPHQLRDSGISPFVRIVTLANIFDALTTNRNHQRANTTFNALSILGSEMRLEVDQSLLRHFIAMMGRPQ